MTRCCRPCRKPRHRKPKGGQLSCREVSRELAASGFLNERGKPYAAKCVASMLKQRASPWGGLQTVNDQLSVKARAI
jgi:hypothetical protein